MTKDLAHEILNLWRSGVRNYQESIITQALVITGDITGSLDRKYPEVEDL